MTLLAVLAGGVIMLAVTSRPKSGEEGCLPRPGAEAWGHYGWNATDARMAAAQTSGYDGLEPELVGRARVILVLAYAS